MLNLSANKLTKLPTEIGKLTSLTELDLDFNRLTALPPELEILVYRGVIIHSGNPLKG